MCVKNLLNHRLIIQFTPFEQPRYFESFRVLSQELHLPALFYTKSNGKLRVHTLLFIIENFEFFIVHLIPLSARNDVILICEIYLFKAEFDGIYNTSCVEFNGFYISKDIQERCSMFGIYCLV